MAASTFESGGRRALALAFAVAGLTGCGGTVLGSSGPDRDAVAGDAPPDGTNSPDASSPRGSPDGSIAASLPPLDATVPTDGAESADGPVDRDGAGQTFDAGPGAADAAPEAAAPGHDAGVACTGASCPSDWPTFAYAPSHAGYNTAERGVPPMVGRWDAIVSASASLNPACAEGGVAFVTYDTGRAPALLSAIDVASGSVLWTFDLGTPASVGQPSVASGTVYVQTNKGISGNPKSLLWAIDAAKGTLVWSAPFDSQWESFWAPTVADGNVYINGGSYGGLYGFGAAKGAELFFNANFYQCDSWSPAYYGSVLYSYVQGSFTASDPATGALLWNNSIRGDWPYPYSMDAVAALDGQRAYVVAPPQLAALDLVTQDFDWITTGSFTGTPAVADGVVYATSGGALVASDAATGTQLFTFTGDGHLTYPPIVAAGVVYVSSANGTFAVSASTQGQLWTAGFGGWLSVASGTLMVASPDGTLHGFALTQGASPVAGDD